jgi:hypothetical protein
MKFFKRKKDEEEQKEIEKSNLEYRISKIARPYLVIHKLIEIIPENKLREYRNKTFPLVSDMYFDLREACNKAKSSELFSTEEIHKLNKMIEGRYEEIQRWLEEYKPKSGDENSPNYYF